MKPLTNCINCGGILEDGKCPFCGADYNKAKHISVDFDKGNEIYATITIGEEVFEAYLAKFEIEPIIQSGNRDIKGRLHAPKIGTVRQWRFVQKDITWN